MQRVSNVPSTHSLLRVVSIAAALALASCASERGDYQRATEQDTLAAFEEFLAKHPQGELSAQALARVRVLELEAAKARNTLEAYAALVQKHPGSAEAAEASKLISRVFDGAWQGKTEQGQPVRFTVADGSVTEFEIGAKVAGYGCSAESTVSTTAEGEIVDCAFTIHAPSGPGGISIDADGTFSSADTIGGLVDFTLHPIPGPPWQPRCGGGATTKWRASRQGTEARPASDRSACPKPPEGSGGASLGSGVALLSPEDGAEVDNKCAKGKDPQEWTFSWKEAPGASRYHLYVIHRRAREPLIDEPELTATSFRTKDNGNFTESNRQGWRWKVRAMVDGKWGDWSSTREFSVEPMDTDCRSQGGGKPQ